MQRDEIRGTLKHIFEEETGNSLASLQDDVVLAEEFDLDSVDMVSLIMHVEGHFHIRMTHEELAEVTTVGSLIDLVQAKVAAADGGSRAPRAAA